MNMPNFKLDKDGLVTAVVQDSLTRQVLMVAWVNLQAYEKMAKTGETWFWSRSRQELWHKGGTSGNTQKIVRMSVDCDLDTLLIEVEPNGPACHTGQASCFFTELEMDQKPK